MKAWWAALRFMTIIPVPDRWCGGQAELGLALWWFPLVGALVGGLAAVVAGVATALLPPFAAATVIVLSLAVLSGGLHLDGLADSADGLLSWRPRERALEIMKDSHIGTMGVLALGFTLILKIALLEAVVRGASPARLLAVVWLMPLAGRCAMAPSMMLLPYARGEGLGALFWQRRPLPSLIALVALATAALGTLGFDGAWLLFGFALTTGICCRWCWRRLGGGTGDTLGACSELNELAVVFVAALLVS